MNDDQEPFILYLNNKFEPVDKDIATLARVNYPDGRALFAIVHPIDIESKSLKSAFTPEQKAALWKANDTTATKWEPRFSDAAVEAFDYDMREMLVIVNDAKTKAKEAKASIAWQDTFLAILDYIQSGGTKNWRSTFAPVMTGVITDQGKRWAAQLGASFDVRNFFAEAWFDKYTLVFAQQINQTTLDELGVMFKQAQAEGWPIETMQSRMTKMFKQWSRGDIPKEEFEWYKQRMPPYRTEMIARTETIRSSNAGSQQLFTEWGVQKHEWLSTIDDRTRTYEKGDAFDHKSKAVNGQIQPIDQPFEVSGEKLMYPGDPAGSPGNTINCVIGDTNVLPIGVIQAATVREYIGEVIEITTARGVYLTVTPNHPILTRRGFLAARCLIQGDDVINGFTGESIRFFSKPDVNNIPSTIEEIYSSLSVAFIGQRIIARSVDFHGDGKKGYVDIVTTDRILRDSNISSLLNRFDHDGFFRADLPSLELIADGAALSSDFDGFGSISLERSGNMRSAGIVSPLLRSHVRHLDFIGGASSTWGNASRDQAWSNGSSSEFESIGQLLFAHSVEVQFDKIIDVNVSSFAGHVYNLQTESGMFIANGIITHNCRCTVLPVMED